MGQDHDISSAPGDNNALRKLTRQNITKDNKTQGVMEKSQWDLKHIRFTSGRLTRLDDFVAQYRISHTALLKEYEDSERVFRRKTYRVEKEIWKEKQQKKRGRSKPFPFKTSKKKSSVSEGPIGKQISPPQPRSSLEGDHENIVDIKSKTTATPQNQLTTLWKRRDTEVVVSVVPTQTKVTSFIIHHSELCTLRPHQWLNGEIIEALFHIAASELEIGNSIYILNHYMAGVILFGEKPQLARQKLSKINLNNYQGIVSFVNIDNVHWKFLFINAVNHTVYLVDPSRSPTEKDDSIHAAQKLSEYIQMRNTQQRKTEWQNIQWKGGVMTHPVQQDGSSCGVIVVLMAREIMKAFPNVPILQFGTSRKEMANERKMMALQILKASVFDEAENCSMCSLKKPTGCVHRFINWIQCDSCERWYHEKCLGMAKEDLEQARANRWSCILCS
ncbi:uncharacterized protein LOC127942748 isoform X1 [Carassius gibelio]|uniref:uncharacterized protein LOC127942748 isoform X1 n=1 Tax=Carassius gibelio TaxID=101364 RepID=UPI002278ADD2|nr:uncharacterized protein LOC127942748 isoform X1 [Carassius gibelio]